MEGYPKEARLKDGTTLILRPMERDDLEGLHSFFCALPAEDRLYLKEDVTDKGVIERWVHNIDHDHILVILATLEGQVVGDATLHVPRHGWARHVGEIRCVVAREQQQRGIGVLLVHQLLQHAITRGLKRIMGQMMEDQIGAIKAFEMLGFKREATLKGHAIDIEGNVHDIVVMTNETEEVWKTLEELILDLDLGVKR